MVVRVWRNASAQDRPKVIYTPIVLTGQDAPGPVGGSFQSFPYHSVINDANQIVFLGSTGNPWEPHGLYLAGDEEVEHVAHIRQPAPGFPTGVEIQSFDINYHRANNKGQVVFESTLSGPGIDETGVDHSNAFANWFWSDGELQLVAQFRTPAPGTNVDFRTFGRTTVNDLGHVAFAGDLIGDGVSPGNDSAMWYGPPDDIRLLARRIAGAGGRHVRRHRGTRLSVSRGQWPNGIHHGFVRRRPSIVRRYRGRLEVSRQIGRHRAWDGFRVCPD